MLLKIIAFISVVLVATFAFTQVKSKPPRVHMSGFFQPGNQRVINVKLQAQNISDSEIQPVEIKARISAPFDFDELKYKWILAENVQLSSGQLEGEFKSISKQSTKTTTITVTGFSSKQNRQVVIQVWGFRNGKKVYSDSIIASNVEQTFEDVVKNVEKMKAEEN